MESFTDTQRTQDWYDARVGKFTCSEIWKLLTEPRSKADKEAGNLSETAKTYIYEKVSESITGVVHQISSPALEWGVEHEPSAKEAYKKVFELEVEETGLVGNKMLAGSPDGIATDGGLDEGVLEIKCPFNQSVHLSNLLLSPEDFKSEGKEYYWQVQGYMFLTDSHWADFVSFHPYFPPDKCLAAIRVERNQDDILLLMEKVEKAYTLKEEILKKLK